MKKKTRLIRKVIFKKRKNFLSYNPSIFLRKNIYFYSQKSFFVSKQNLSKFILMLKWFKRIQKKEYGILCSFEVKFHPVFFCTKKGLGVRMGKGKGAKNYYFGQIKGGHCFLIVKNIVPSLTAELKKKIILYYPLKTKGYSSKLLNGYR